MSERPASPHAWLGLSALAALGALLLAAAPTGWPAALDWAPELAFSQPWRAVTAAWVHLSRLHLLANLAGCALVAALGVVAGCDRRAAAAWALAWPLTHAALLLQPALSRYAGLSGVLHAAVAVAVVQLLVAERRPRGTLAVPPRAAVGAAIGAGLVIKLLLEAPWQGPLRQVPGWDIAIAPLAHSAGALAGGLCAGLLGVGRRQPLPR